jgi:hypothetical protein
MTQTQSLAENLCEAAQRGNKEKVEELSLHSDKAKFVNVSSPKFSNMTALHFASCGKPFRIPVLLNMGANIEQRDDDNFTPLLHASSQDGSVECVLLLLDAGADVSVMCGMNKSALFYAQGNEEKVSKRPLRIQITTYDCLQTKLLTDAMKEKESHQPPPASNTRSRACTIS